MASLRKAITRKFHRQALPRPYLATRVAYIVILLACVSICACSSSGTGKSDFQNDSIPEENSPSMAGAISTPTTRPATNPDADTPAAELLAYLQALSGKQILSGQEQLFWDNEFAPHFPSIREDYIYDRVFKYPALYSTDFGDFHHETDLTRRADILAMRPGVVDATLAHAQRGSIIQLHYHMVEPTEPDGSGLRNYRDGAYPEEYIDQILTPGSELNQVYETRLDEMALYLTRLKDEGVAVLWRPFHEMNGPWFWWSRQPRFAELWQHQWEYFTEKHKLSNLLWVFSVNHWQKDSGAEWEPATYYPGHRYVDVLGVDIYEAYGHNYDQYVYDTLLEVGDQRPIAITENGKMPDWATLRLTQPRWVYWATWFGDESTSPDSLYTSNYVTLDAYVVTQDETFDPVQIPIDVPQPEGPITVQDPPTSTSITLTATAGNQQATLNWNPDPNVTWYNVWFGTSRENIAWLEGTGSNSFTARQLSNGESYFFAVTPYTNDSDGEFSNIVEVVLPSNDETPPDNTPDPESSITLSVEASGNGSVTLSWNPAPDATWYNVWFGTERENIDWLEGTGANRFVATQLASGVPYYFAVTPYINDADGAFSNIVEVILD